MSLLRLMHAEIGMASLNEAKVRARVEKLIGEGMVVLAVDRGRVVGACGLFFAKLWYSDDDHLGENFFFIHSNHRCSSHAVRLMKTVNAIGQRLGVPVYLSVVTKEDTLRKCDFFARHNRLVGQIFVGGAGR
jgi:hypothetical protein